MNRKIVGLLIMAAALGVVAGRYWQSQEAPIVQAESKREILYWRAPMDPSYRRNEPGKSPMGMDLLPVYADEADDSGTGAGVVTIRPQIAANLGIRSAAAQLGVLPRRIDTVGYVNFDENTLQHVHSRVDGWVEKLVVKTTGDPVAAGQLLFELYSPALVSAQEEYLAALSSRNAVLQEASRSRLSALGVSAGEIGRLDRERSVSRLVQVYASAGGVVADLGIREGMYITPAMPIMSIANLERVWILAEVFERQAAWVEAGQEAEVELDYLPGERLRGVVDYVYPELDPKTRALKVRLRFDNKAHMLRPNMFARLTIFATETGALVHVPREALIRGGKANRVVIALGDGRFRVQNVAVGIESGDRVEIRSGLAPGDVVVTSGQFLIDSESNIESALMRINADSGEPGSPGASHRDMDMPQ